MGTGIFPFRPVPGAAASHEASDPGPNPLLSVLQALQIGLRTDHEIVVLAQTRTAGDQVSADDVLLQVFQRVDLRLDGSLVEDLGGLLERSGRDELEVWSAARVIPCKTWVEVAGTMSRTCTGRRSRRLRLEFSSRSLRSETICPGCSAVESPASVTTTLS